MGYASHAENHTPQVNGGIVIKTNAMQKYTSEAIGAFIVKRLAERSFCKVLEVRNGM
jgi:aspartyl aminopeptidase